LTTTPTTPTGPTIPLTPEVRAAYQDLYNKLETAIENTIDVGTLETLNASQLDIGNILIKNSEYQLAANTALFNALLQQINTANVGLKALKAQIIGISNDISTFANILGAIDKVLTMVPGF
jgi:hypothetical protein